MAGVSMTGGNVADGEVEVFVGQHPAEGGNIFGAAGVPVAVDNQPVAQVLHLAGGDELEQLGANF